MADLIDRQAAIDGIKKEMLERDGRFFKGLLVANHVIVHLPSAQAFEDTINRKQAIEAFEPEHNKDWYTPTIIEVLEALPPAQPQRKSGQLLYHHTENIDEVKTADVYFCSSCKKEVLKKKPRGTMRRMRRERMNICWNICRIKEISCPFALKNGYCPMTACVM